MRFSYLFSLIFIFSFLPSLQAKEAPSPPAEYRWLSSTKLVHGDYQGYVIELLGRLLQNPDRPSMALAIEKIGRYGLDSPVYPLVTEAIPLLYKRKINNGYVRQALKNLYAKILRREGKYQEIKKLHLKRGYLRQWHLLGSFGYSGRLLYHRPFQIELDQTSRKLDYKRTYRGRGKEISWKTTKIKGTTCYPWKKLKEKKGCVYAVAQVFLDSPKPVILKVSNPGDFRLWLNGSPLMAIQRAQSYYPITLTASIYLQKGWNRLFFKIVPSIFSMASLSVQLLDVRGNPLNFKEESRGFFHPISPSAPKFYRGQKAVSPLEFYRQKRKTPWALAALGQLKIESGLVPQGLNLLEQAKKMAPQNHQILHLWLQALGRASFVPGHFYRNQAKKIYEEILKEDPLFLAGYFYLSQYYKKNDKPLKAIQVLEKALQKNSHKLKIYYEMAQICFGEKWQAQGMEYIKKCEKIQPSWDGVLRFWESYYRSRGNYSRAWKYTSQLLKKSKSLDFIQISTAYHLLELGERAKAMKIFFGLIKKHPKNLQYIRILYSYYKQKSQYNKAIDLYRKLMKDDWSKAASYKTLGELYLKSGKKTEAIHWFSLSLREEPGQHSLRSYLRFLEGKSEDYARPYRLDIRKYMAKAPGADQYPKAHAAMVIDQTVVRIYADGSTSQTIHSAHKILDEKGKEVYHTLQVNGEIQELRTFDRAGKIWEPIIPQKGNIVPPALEKGAVLETKTRIDGWGGHPFEFRWGPFFFKDSSYDEPVVISQLVVICSNQYPIKILEKNFTTPAKITRKKNDTIYIWTFENQGRTEIERFMAPQNELLPYVMLYTNQPLEEHIWLLDGKYSADVRTTPQIKRTAEKILSSTKGKSQYEKVKKLYQYVHTTIPTGWGQGLYGSSMRVLLEKRGDRGVLFTALLKAVGIEYHRAYILAKKNPVIKKVEEIQENLSYKAGFLLKVLPKGHKPLWVTCAIRNLPLGKIPGQLQGGRAFVFHQGRFYVEELPQEAKEKKATAFGFDLTLNKKGNLSGSFSLTMPGTRGDRLKEVVKNRPYYWKQNIVERMANGFFPGARVSKFQFLRKPSAPFQVKVSFSVANYLRKRGDSYELKTGFPPLSLSRTFAGKAHRTQDIFFPSANSVLSFARIRLGQHWSLKELPKSILVENAMGTYSYTYSLRGSELTLERRFFLQPFRLKARQYKDLINWAQKIDSRDRELVILKRRGN